jgi:hypothetical protein
MSGRRSKDIRKVVREYMVETRMDIKNFKGYYRRAKKDYVRGI